MKKTLGKIVLLAGIASAGFLGSQVAQADYVNDGNQVQAKCDHQGDHNHRQHGDHKEGRHCGCREGHHDFGKITERLGLSAEQKGKVKEIFEKNRQQGEPLRKELFSAKRELMGLALAEKTDEAAIRVQAVKLAGIEADMAIHRARLNGQIRAILTPEQLEKFSSLHKEQHLKSDERKEQK
jgi:periplasmic protein CpxP/Spy